MFFPSVVVQSVTTTAHEQSLGTYRVGARLLGYVRELSLGECLFTLNLDTTKYTTCFNLSAVHWGSREKRQLKGAGC